MKTLTSSSLHKSVQTEMLIERIIEQRERERERKKKKINNYFDCQV